MNYKTISAIEFNFSAPSPHPVTLEEAQKIIDAVWDCASGFQKNESIPSLLPMEEIIEAVKLAT